MIDAQEDGPINSALRQFEATEANLAKLERLWSEISKLTPSGLQLGSDPAYEEGVIAWQAYPIDFPWPVSSTPRRFVHGFAEVMAKQPTLDKSFRAELVPTSLPT